MNLNTTPKTAFNAQFFTNKGLNIQAVFNISSLPEEIRKSLPQDHFKAKSANQLIVLGHAGRKLWDLIGTTLKAVDDPVDNYSISVVKDYFYHYHPERQFEIIYPEYQCLALQQLGELAGWHNDSPFRVGINNLWGSWFAYRAVVLADTNFLETKKMTTHSPCTDCVDKICIGSCPPEAVNDEEMSLTKCIDYRKQDGSSCKLTCLARSACPVAQDHRYSEEQMQYHYNISLKTIEALYRS